jgi:2-phosphosulfolactate phosphatase
MKTVVHCEWGRQGLAAHSAEFDVVIIVDVLSFSTCVNVAASRGATIYPVEESASRSEEVAKHVRAELAGRRGTARFSLSPASFLEVASGERIVLASPNGARLSPAANSSSVMTGCLRNARAVAVAALALGNKILVVPAGERWPDGSLRPCLEDWLGAGAIIEVFAGDLSPEAEAARQSFRAACTELQAMLEGCTSGKELIDLGYAQDVELASQLNWSTAVPILSEKAFRSWPG